VARRGDAEAELEDEYESCVAAQLVLSRPVEAA